ncbi:mannose-1-phosphate guanylyltransferase/mannose-6-phosphate isomerase [Frigidibacter sp. RF13]|uniref:mannose-1-phosphate guanylyltransferase/mannose-6-phosphate isomerase n=1 Tax=Frigidibacter sp. RF13 TaxID=2997340 RepID=UPI00226F68AC|nr:mannose-1-phosphate guanylyltransferase/mannose-6-phosphate isomerase [Frigidibacter sp. RF13]MCY1128195.1 mannose-1-phosphate guanylyltransferase/mannose-6-phosphate isomerase [Frigidibacter sp. RF13]
MTPAIRPVILSGGTGTRLWPVSREGMAKQLLPLAGDRTMLQATLQRVTGAQGFGPAMVIGAHPVRFILKDQIEAVAPATTLVLEPARRDTFAAVLLAATLAASDDPDAILAVMPSDHLISGEATFCDAVRAAAARAASGGVVVIGVQPTEPATGYGYIRPGAETAPGLFAVERFVEKPDEAGAAKLIAEGCLWNAGLFVFRAGWLIDALAKLYPGDVSLMEEAVRRTSRDLGMLIPGAAFSDVRQISFDHAFMEKTREAFVVPATFSWSDVGDWNALWKTAARDADGNALRGDVVAKSTKNTLVRAESRTVCTLGVEDLTIVETPDAVLVAHRDAAQEVKGLVEALKAAGNPAASEHIRTHRPWGWYQTTDLGDRFRVKRIQVRPGAKLSLQRHHHRSEHWVVVRGTAEVTVDGTVRVLHENESAYIPIGAIHRLANPGKIPVEIIEVQTGAYLEEDDIERIEDEFGRA